MEQDGALRNQYACMHSSHLTRCPANQMTRASLPGILASMHSPPRHRPVLELHVAGLLEAARWANGVFPLVMRASMRLAYYQLIVDAHCGTPTTRLDIGS